MKIGRNDIIKIATSKYKLLDEPPIKKIDYDRWVKFIEAHKDYFVWYEDTPDGIDAKQNIDMVPDWAREGTLKRLNKLCAYSTNKIVKRPYDFIVDYGINDGMVRINIERKMTKLIAEILLEMAKFLDGKIIINGNKILESKEQLDDKKTMTRSELIKLGKKIQACKEHDKLAKMLELFDENVPHPDGSRLFCYPEGSYYAPLNYNPTVEEVVDKALSYKLI